MKTTERCLILLPILALLLGLSIDVMRNRVPKRKPTVDLAIRSFANAAPMDSPVFPAFATQDSHRVKIISGGNSIGWGDSFIEDPNTHIPGRAYLMLASNLAWQMRSNTIVVPMPPSSSFQD